MCVGLIVSEKNDDDDDDDKPIYVRDVSDRFALKMPYFSKDLTHSVPLNVPPNWGMESDGSRRLWMEWKLAKKYLIAKIIIVVDILSH